MVAVAVDLANRGLEMARGVGYVAWGIQRLLPIVTEAQLRLGNLEAAAEFAHYADDDPYAQPDERAPVAIEIDVAVIDESLVEAAETVTLTPSCSISLVAIGTACLGSA